MKQEYHISYILVWVTISLVVGMCIGDAYESARVSYLKDKTERQAILLEYQKLVQFCKITPNK